MSASESNHSLPHPPDAPPVALIERRTNPREPQDGESTYLWVSFKERFSSTIRDQSPEGLGVIASRADASDFEIDFQIRVELEERVYRMARIVHVTDYDEDNLLVGLCWED